MELKFKEVGKEYSVELSGLKIRPYLKIEEINDIVNQCLKTDNQVERELIKGCKVVEYCTNVDLGEGDIQGEEVYNMVTKLGTTNSIRNYYVINECIDKSEGFYAIGKMFVDSVNKKLDELSKEVNTEKTQTLLNQIKEVVK